MLVDANNKLALVFCEFNTKRLYVQEKKPLDNQYKQLCFIFKTSYI